MLVGSVRHGGDSHDLDDQVALSQRNNADHFRRWRVVGAAMFRAVLSQEFIEHVQPEIGRAQHVAVRERSLNVEGQLDEMLERELPTSSTSALMLARMERHCAAGSLTAPPRRVEGS